MSSKGAAVALSEGFEDGVRQGSVSVGADSVHRAGLTPSPYFITKIQQLIDICAHHSFTIVSGEAGSGKSSVINCFTNWLQAQKNQQVVVDRLVVGTLQTHELFGYYTSSKYTYPLSLFTAVLTASVFGSACLFSPC